MKWYVFLKLGKSRPLLSYVDAVEKGIQEIVYMYSMKPRKYSRNTYIYLTSR